MKYNENKDQILFNDHDWECIERKLQKDGYSLVKPRCIINRRMIQVYREGEDHVCDRIERS